MPLPPLCRRPPEFEGTRYDCGDKLGYLQATVEFGVKHPEFGDAFADYLAKRNR